MCVNINSLAQDIIVKKDGSIIHSKVLELNSSEIKYKKYSNLEGPIYVLNKTELLSINYENGEIEQFVVEPIDMNYNKEREVEIDTNNLRLINEYNKPIQSTKKLKNKQANWCTLQYSFTEESVLSNKEVEVVYVRGKDNLYTGTEGTISDEGDICIKIRNKSNATIFVDLGESYYICKNKESSEHKYFYNLTKNTTITQETSSGGLAAIGNLAVGAAGQKGSSITYTQERILKIPPQSTGVVCETKVQIIHIQVYVFEPPTHIEEISRGLELYRYTSELKRGEVIDYNVMNSPITYDLKFKYSMDPTFSSYSVIENTLYLSKMIGYHLSDIVLQGKSLVTYFWL